jgi:Dyp-type peroxidase family
MMKGQLDFEDIQAIIFTGHGRLRLARYVFMQVREREKVKRWLGRMADEVKTGTKLLGDKRHLEEEGPAPGRAVHVAFTAQGLRALGLPEEALETFPREFVQGMAHPDRSRVLGDTGMSAPAHWQFGGGGGDGAPAGQEVHLVLMLFTEDDRRDGQDTSPYLEHQCSEGEAGVRGLKVVFIQDAHLSVRGGKAFKEAFGFSDGISQPNIEGYSPPSTQGLTLKPGEVILGYENAYGQKPLSPTVPAGLDALGLLPEATPGLKDLGRNGSYMVVRKLWQDTKAFKTFLEKKGGGREGQARLAARLVGRWPSGAPLSLCPEKDDERLGEDRSRNNCFGYAQDPHGTLCPLGSHIRRANPRDGLIPGEPKTSLEVVARHQIIRRGRSYSDDTGAYDGMDQGLFFIALNANIQRQFEFIQHTWLNNPKFADQFEGKDPIVGDNPELEPGTGPGVMTLPGFPVSERVEGVTRFVQVQGGGYFFLPGVRALRFLSALK